MGHQVSAILLAAGSARRMGRLKQLLPLGDKTVIRHCLDNVLDSGIRDTVVVVGRGGDIVAYEADDARVKIACNNDPESDMAESVRTGLLYIDVAPTGVLVCLADHPLVSASTMKSLVSRHSSAPDKIIIPVCKGRKGHPTLFPSALISRIFSLSNLREIVQMNSKSVIFEKVDDEGIFLDMDTMEDYRLVMERFGKIEAQRGSGSFQGK